MASDKPSDSSGSADSSGSIGHDRIEVVDRPEASRFEIILDGELAGFAEYHDDDGLRTFPHTVVDPEHEGQGLSGHLIGEALDATRADDLQMLPTCSAVRHYLTKHTEYVDMVPAQRREELGL